MGNNFNFLSIYIQLGYTGILSEDFGKSDKLPVPVSFPPFSLLAQT